LLVAVPEAVVDTVIFLPPKKTTFFRLIA